MRQNAAWTPYRVTGVRPEHYNRNVYAEWEGKGSRTYGSVTICILDTYLADSAVSRMHGFAQPDRLFCAAGACQLR
jgi:hypothetical protein